MGLTKPQKCKISQSMDLMLTKAMGLAEVFMATGLDLFKTMGLK